MTIVDSALEQVHGGIMTPGQHRVLGYAGKGALLYFGGHYRRMENPQGNP